MKVSKSCSAILKAAEELLFKHGIKKVTVEEICNLSQTSKMTFYRNFKNKEEVALRCLNNLIEDNHRDYRKIMDDTISYNEKFKLIIALKKKGLHKLSDVFISDIYASPRSEYVKTLANYQQKMLIEMEADFTLAQEIGAIRSNINVKFIFYIFNKISEITTDETLLAMYHSKQQCYEEIIDFLFYGILTDKKI